jgi:hypothetical protein
MTAVQSDIIIESGSTYSESFRITGVNYHASHVVIMSFRRDHSSSTALKVLSSATGGIAVSGSGSSHTDIAVTLTATETAAFPNPFRGVYTIEATLSGVSTRVMEGSFFTTPEA